MLHIASPTGFKSFPLSFAVAVHFNVHIDKREGELQDSLGSRWCERSPTNVCSPGNERLRYSIWAGTRVGMLSFSCRGRERIGGTCTVKLTWALKSPSRCNTLAYQSSTTYSIMVQIQSRGAFSFYRQLKVLHLQMLCSEHSYSLKVKANNNVKHYIRTCIVSL